MRKENTIIAVIVSLVIVMFGLYLAKMLVQNATDNAYMQGRNDYKNTCEHLSNAKQTNFWLECEQ